MTSPYNSPDAGYQPVVAPAGRNNPLALTSLICSLVGIVFPLGFIAGIITGHIAQSQIRCTHENGRGMAKAGLIIGYIGLALFVLFWAAVIITALLTPPSSSSY